MTSKNKSSLSRTITDVVQLIPNLVRIVCNITTLINFEARLAGKALIGIVMLAVISAILVTSIWICLLALLATYLLSIQWSLMMTLVIVLLLNICLFIIVTIMMAKAKKNLFFPATSEECRELKERI